MKSFILFLFLLPSKFGSAQTEKLSQDSTKKMYLAELKLAGKKFTNDLYPNYVSIYSLSEDSFLLKINTVRIDFSAVLNKYRKNLTIAYVKQQQSEIKYYFDKLLIEYPLNHDIYVSKTSTKPSKIAVFLKKNLSDFNNPSLLSNSDFTSYVRAYFSYSVIEELKKKRYKKSDNKQLAAVWKLISSCISQPQCKAFWQFDYLYNYIDNNGIKNIDNFFHDFKSTCTDSTYISKINMLYSEDSVGRTGHLITPYKTVGTFGLDMHIFLSDSLKNRTKRPVIIFFHGGSWSEGKPDWFFYSCESYAKKGWVACAVEYRTYGRYGTLPFEAVKDARSAIRWVREHANEYNIDTGRIVASGNSAGGHLVLCTALANKWNEVSDNIQYSSVPNLLLVNSGVYDLTDQNTAWIRKDLIDKNIVKEISPNYLVRKHLPPTLLIHGTEDRNVPYMTAETFAALTKRTGNLSVEFKTLDGAGHFIWYDPKYSAEVSKLRTDFLAKLGY